MGIRFLTTSAMTTQLRPAPAGWLELSKPERDARKAERAAYAEEREVAQLQHGGGHVKAPLFTTGRLEAALEAGHRVVVISSRRQAMEHDRWWMERVHDVDIHFVGPGLDGALFTAKVKDLVESYGIEYPLNPMTGEPEFWPAGLYILNQAP